MASNYKTGASLNLTPFEMQLLSRSPLFRGAGESGIGEMLSCLGAEERSYEKEEMIYRLIGEVRQKPSPDGFRRCIEDPAGQLQVFLRRDCKQVADKLRVMSARIGTLRQHFSNI